MFRLFRPRIVELLNIRDAVVADRRKEHSDEDVFEDRKLEHYPILSDHLTGIILSRD